MTIKFFKSQVLKKRVLIIVVIVVVVVALFCVSFSHQF